jgi:hypothetical protein
VLLLVVVVVVWGCVCDLETSTMRRLRLELDCCFTKSVRYSLKTVTE